MTSQKVAAWAILKDGRFDCAVAHKIDVFPNLGETLFPCVVTWNVPVVPTKKPKGKK